MTTRAAWWFDRAVLAAVALVPLGGVIVAVDLAWSRGYVGGVNIALFFAFWAATMFGIEAGYHRYFSHRAFRAGRGFEAALVILGSMAFQGPAVWWAAVHRRHHRFADDHGDPHSPHLAGTGVRAMVAGLWDAHAGWNVREFETMRDKTSWKHLVPDLLANRWLRTVNRGYFVWLVLGLVVPAALGGVITSSWLGALDGLLWGGLVRMFAVTQGIYLVNSIGHAFGSRPFALHARDRATNNSFVALVTLGAGFHHNHHIFPASATNRIAPWQVDVVGAVLTVLEWAGVVRDLHRPPVDALTGWTRQATVRLRGDGGVVDASVAGLSARGMFVESRRAARLLPLGARVQLDRFRVSGPGAPTIPDAEAVVERSTWQGIGVRFVAPSPELCAAVERVRHREPATEPASSVLVDEGSRA
jgi:stearoyl-CoA desaturase (delta-9 desaturase)